MTVASGGVAMGAASAPAQIKCVVGVMLYPELDPPWPFKLLVLVGIGWLILGPIIVYVAARRGRAARGVIVYACGVFALIAFLMTWLWDWWMPCPGRSGFGDHFAAILRYAAPQILEIGGVLVLVAVLVGLFWPPSRWGWVRR
jgi:hypothetical protein